MTNYHCIAALAADRSNTQVHDLSHSMLVELCIKPLHTTRCNFTRDHPLYSIVADSLKTCFCLGLCPGVVCDRRLRLTLSLMVPHEFDSLCVQRTVVSIGYTDGSSAQLQASIVATDAQHDLAVLRIDAAPELVQPIKVKGACPMCWPSASYMSCRPSSVNLSVRRLGTAFLQRRSLLGGFCQVRGCITLGAEPLQLTAGHVPADGHFKRLEGWAVCVCPGQSTGSHSDPDSGGSERPQSCDSISSQHPDVWSNPGNGTGHVRDACYNSVGSKVAHVQCTVEHADKSTIITWYATQCLARMTLACVALQTDAPINGGSSGGALLDSAGRLVGISTATFGRKGSVSLS